MEGEIQFLRVCVSGTSNLSSVLNIWKTAQKASGSGGNTLTLQEYVTLLQPEAQTHDGGNKFSKNPRVTHSVHQYKFVTDDYDTPEYEINVHNVDTPLEELLVNEARSFPRNNSPPRNDNGNRPRKVMMNIETWKSLSKQDQDGWDTVSDDGKRKILEYAKTRGTPSEDPSKGLSTLTSSKTLDHPSSRQASTRFPQTVKIPSERRMSTYCTLLPTRSNPSLNPNTPLSDLITVYFWCKNDGRDCVLREEFMSI